MTDRERFNRQMHFESVDRCFNCEFGYWDENFTSWPIFKENGIRNNEEADLFFNFDRKVDVVTPDMHPLFEEEVLSETETSRIIRRPEGLIAEVPKDGHDTIPHFLESSIETPDDWQRCKEERFRRDDPVRTVDIEALTRAHPADRDYPLGVHCGSMIGKVRDLLTFEGLAYACYDYPEMVEDMVETHCLLIEDFLDQVLPFLDFDYAAGWEDICFRSGPLVTLDFFGGVVVPRYKRIQARLEAAGIDVWYTDTDGDIRPLIPFFPRERSQLPVPVRGEQQRTSRRGSSRVRQRPADARRRRQEGVDRGAGGDEVVPGESGAAGGTRGLHPARGSSLPAGRHPGYLPLLSRPEGADVRDVTGNRRHLGVDLYPDAFSSLDTIPSSYLATIRVPG